MSNVITGGRPGALAHAAEDSHIICASSMQRARRLLLLQRRCYLIVGRFSPKPLPVSTPVALVVTELGTLGPWSLGKLTLLESSPSLEIKGLSSLMHAHYLEIARCKMLGYGILTVLLYMSHTSKIFTTMHTNVHVTCTHASRRGLIS